MKLKTHCHQRKALSWRKRALNSPLKKHFLRSNCCFASWEDYISPTLPIVTGRETVFSTAFVTLTSFMLVELGCCILSNSRILSKWTSGNLMQVVIWVCNNASKTRGPYLNHSAATTISRTIAVGKMASPQKSSLTTIGEAKRTHWLLCLITCRTGRGAHTWNP